MFTEAKVTIDLAEYQEMQRMITEFSKPSEDGELSPIELQEATGTLLKRALDNPRIFYGKMPEIPLGKYKAIFVYLETGASGKDTAQLLVKLVRT